MAWHAFGMKWFWNDMFLVWPVFSMHDVCNLTLAGYICEMTCLWPKVCHPKSTSKFYHKQIIPQVHHAKSTSCQKQVMSKARHGKRTSCQKHVIPKALHGKSMSCQKHVMPKVYHLWSFVSYSIWATLFHKIRPQCCIYIVCYDLGRIQISFAPAARSVI